MPHLGHEQRALHSPYFNLLKEAAVNNKVLYFKYLRMNSTLFEEICQRVGPVIHRADTRFRKAVTVGM